MQLRIPSARGRGLKIAGVLLAAGVLAVVFRDALGQVLRLVLEAAAVAFLAEPLARLFERRLSRRLAALASLAAIVLALGLALWLLLPAMLRELAELVRTLPASLRQAAGWLEDARTWLERRLPGVSLPALPLGEIGPMLTGVVAGAVALVGGLADAAGRVSLAVVLSYFFLCDRARLLLRLELLLPRSFRRTAVEMGNAICRELRLYLRGQALVAAAVSALASAGLALVGLRSALVLGPVIGLLNMIPYFGPFIGGVPAVLIALGDGWRRAALTLAVLVGVQQLDGSLISPRIMGGLTGLSPAAVLVAIFAGARVAGIGGMLLALPAVMTIRTLFRVFVQRHENI